MKYPELVVERKSGDEPFHIDGKELDLNILAFWKWSSSDLINNAMRGILAEFIVSSAVGATEASRVEWDAFDAVTQEGIKIEVKSASYIQTWNQKDYSPIQFGIKPTRGWDAAENIHSKVARRQADIYVFCILNHKDQETLDPLNMSQWEFLVLPTKVLNEKVGDQKTIGINSLKRLGAKETNYLSLYDDIRYVFNSI